MTVKVPTLSSSGWVSEIAEKADKLLSYFFVSEASQSNFYAGSITSLTALLQRYGNDEFELRSAVETSLMNYLQRYFESVDVTVTVRENTVEGRKGLDLEVDIVVYEQGKEYSLGRLVSTLNSSIMKIAELNNTGALPNE